MKDFEKPVFYVKDSKKTFSPSVVDWKKKQIKGRKPDMIKMREQARVMNDYIKTLDARISHAVLKEQSK